MAKRETANRVRGRIETIIAKNANIDDLDFRNPAELTKQLREKLPKRPKRVIRHHPALPYALAAQFLVELGKAEGRAAVALRFLIFTVCRISGLRRAGYAMSALHAHKATSRLHFSQQVRVGYETSAISTECGAWRLNLLRHPWPAMA